MPAKIRTLAFCATNNKEAQPDAAKNAASIKATEDLEHKKKCNAENNKSKGFQPNYYDQHFLMLNDEKSKIRDAMVILNNNKLLQFDG